MFRMRRITIYFQEFIEPIDPTYIFRWCCLSSTKKRWETKIIVVYNLLKFYYKVPIITKVIGISDFLVFLKIIIDFYTRRLSHLNFQSFLMMLLKLQH